MTVSLILITCFVVNLLTYSKYVKKYNSLINPGSFFIVEYFYFAILSYVGYKVINQGSETSEIILSSMTLIYALGFYIGSHFYKAKFYETDSRGVLKYNTNINSLGVYVLLFLVSYSLLMYLSGAGAMWITNTREAYQFYRGTASVGSLWALSQWFLIFISIESMKIENKYLRNIMIVLCFVSAYSLFGSKQVVIAFFILFIFMHDQFGQKISLYKLSIYSIIIVAYFLYTLASYADDSGMLFALQYLSEYAANTIEVISRPNEFNQIQGQVVISNIVAFIPRVLYVDKPYEYGISLVSGVLFPGAAENGHTPGLIEWITFYVDFGVLGVLIFGILKGRISDYFYSRLVRIKTNSAPLYAIMFTLSLFPILIFGGYVPMFILYLLISLRKSSFKF